MEKEKIRQDESEASRRSLGAATDDILRAGRAVRQDVEQLVAALKRERTEVTRRIEERPLVALGAAFAVGFVLGGGLASRIGSWLMVTALKLGSAQAIRHFTADVE